MIHIIQELLMHIRTLVLLVTVRPSLNKVFTVPMYPIHTKPLDSSSPPKIISPDNTPVDMVGTNYNYRYHLRSRYV